MKKIVFFILMVPVVALSGKGKKEEVKLSSSALYKNEKSEYIIDPFMAFGSYANYHTIAFFDDHPEYECVEAFIYDNPDGEGYIFRAILTDHSDNQVDYTNSEIFKKIRGDNKTKIDRETLLVSGDFKIGDNGKDSILKFYLKDGTEVVLVYLSDSMPEKEWGGMTDPRGHSPDGGIPMMYRNSSSISNKNSYVRFNDKKYTVSIDETISKPPFFIGYSSFLSEGYYFSLLPAHTTEGEIIDCLVKSNDGGSYTSRDDVSSREYFFSNELLEIERIRHRGSLSRSDDYYMDLVFNPPLPNIQNMTENQSLKVGFSVLYSISENEELYGDVIINKNSLGSVEIELLPLFPKWAKGSRDMLYRIEMDKKSYKIRGGIINE